MPFDPAPITKTKFQEYAEAMLRGCAVTTQCRGVLIIDGPSGEPEAACALGAYAIGMGQVPRQMGEIVKLYGGEVYRTYANRYGVEIDEDNDRNGLTREEIAARIAAL
jgi:hypothetical protein